MNDQLIKGYFKGLDVAFTYAVTTNAVNGIVLRHNCDPAAAHILGRAVTGALLSAAILPEGQRINVCWKYRGVLRTIIVDAGQDGTVRGFIAPPQLDLEEDNMDKLYGDLGDLQVVTSQTGKILNSGTAPVPLHDVAKDLAYYHCISDQVETGLNVMIGFNADPENPVRFCQGWMIQALPETDVERFDRLRRRMESPAFRELLSREADCEVLACLLTAEEADFSGLHRNVGPAPKFICPCNRDKMEAVVRTLPIPERMELVQKKEDVVILCQFCNKRYELTIDDCITAWNLKSDAGTP
ncbi:MAG: Hsp33 family molecular chaperone HslO [Kiritimatiellaceae bacterium]|nr:Hsp33 family molecular chaperone HslO [Kiritimatiellaceae bacterium]